MTPSEMKVVERLISKCHLEDLKITHRSNRQFDIVLDGRYGTNAHYMAGVAFTAWLPLMAIRELVNWTSREVAQNTDYPEMCMTGDWSGMRDSSNEKVWAVFKKFAVEA